MARGFEQESWHIPSRSRSYPPHPNLERNVGRVGPRERLPTGINIALGVNVEQQGVNVALRQHSVGLADDS